MVVILLQNNFFDMVITWDNHVIGPFGSEELADQWLKENGYSMVESIRTQRSAIVYRKEGVGAMIRTVLAPE